MPIKFLVLGEGVWALLQEGEEVPIIFYGLGILLIVAHVWETPCRGTPCTPLKGPVAPVVHQLPRVSIVKLPLKGVARYRGV